VSKAPQTLDGIDGVMLCDWLRFCVVGRSTDDIRDWAPSLLPGSPNPAGKLYHYWLWLDGEEEDVEPVRVGVTQGAAGAVLDVSGKELRRRSPAAQRGVHDALRGALGGRKTTMSRVDWAVQYPFWSYEQDRARFDAVNEKYGFDAISLDGLPYLIASTSGVTWQSARQQPVPGRRGAEDRFRLVTYVAASETGIFYRRWEVRESLSSRSTDALLPTQMTLSLLGDVLGGRDLTLDWSSTVNLLREPVGQQSSKPLMRRAVSLALRALGYEPRGGGNRVSYGRAAETDAVLALAAVTEDGLHAACQRWPILSEIAQIEGNRVELAEQGAEVVEPKNLKKTFDFYRES